MHKGREVLGLSSYVSGTGFFVSYEKMKEIGGWKHHLLIEDIEFSAAHVIDKGTTHYAHDAIFMMNRLLVLNQLASTNAVE